MRTLLTFLSAGLLITVAALADSHTGVTVEELARSSVSWDGAPLPAYPEGTPEITILRITIPAGAELPMRRHPVINAGVLLTGELTVFTDDEDSLHLRAGDAIVELVDRWHYGKNTGSEAAVILVFYAGTPEMPITVRQDEPER
jgi:quercetin dioxygenase-like cupin family protein